MITSMIPSRLSSASSASASAGAYRERTVQTLFISINRVSAAYLMTMKAKDVDELLCVLNEIRVWHPYTPATLNLRSLRPIKDKDESDRCFKVAAQLEKECA
jgi:hypothetical protein